MLWSWYPPPHCGQVSIVASSTAPKARRQGLNPVAKVSAPGRAALHALGCCDDLHLHACASKATSVLASFNPRPAARTARTDERASFEATVVNANATIVCADDLERLRSPSRSSRSRPRPRRHRLPRRARLPPPTRRRRRRLTHRPIRCNPYKAKPIRWSMMPVGPI